MQIPIFQEFNELYGAANLSFKTLQDDFHTFKYVDTNASICTKMDAYRNNFFHISLFTNTSHSATLDGKMYTFDNFTLVFDGPGTTFSSSRPLDWEGYSIYFKQEFINIGFENKNFLRDFPFCRRDAKNVFTLNLNQQRYFLPLFDKIHTIYHNREFYWQEKVRLYLNLILIEAKCIYESNGTVNKKSALRISDRFFIDLEENYKNYGTVQQFADSLNVSASYLNNYLKKHTGETAGDLIKKRKMDEARILLGSTHKSISEIAYELSFYDHPHFTKLFKYYFGKSPSEYRKQNRLL